MKKYLLVRVTKKKIEAIQKVSESDRQTVLMNKSAEEQLWTVSSYANSYKMIDDYNDSVNGAKKQVKQNQVSIANTKVEIKLWDWSKVSARKKKRLVRLYEKKEWSKIFIMHNDLELTDETYCCDSYQSKVHFNMKKAKEDGII